MPSFPAVKFFHYWLCFFLFSRKATVVSAGLAANGGKGARGRGGVGRKDAALRRAAIRNSAS